MSKMQLCIYCLRSYGPIIAAIVVMFFIVRATADYEEGLNAAFDGDFATAVQEFTIAAEEGLDLAQYNLAILYFTGQGVDQNFELAFKWTQAAALQGHVDAQFNLASLYFDGSGVSQSNMRGLAWMVSAARGGHVNAAFALAMMHLEGDPIPRDTVQAHAWAAKAVNSGHEGGLALKQAIEEELDPSQLSAARRQFARWQIEPTPDLPAQ
ncbi:MAG: hypothetical protein CMQ15_04495 [Gammaproteobacteria bacterium]|nr:hypothetical protein [Gammaproteobacteria bacterium]